MVVEKFLASCYWFSRLVDQRTNNKNTVVAVINIYCNYLKQISELTSYILQETFELLSFIIDVEYTNKCIPSSRSVKRAIAGNSLNASIHITPDVWNLAIAVWSCLINL